MSHHDIKLYKLLLSIRPRASLMLLNIYYFRFNIFNKGTSKRLSEKKGTLSENFGGPDTPCSGGSVLNILQWLISHPR